MGQAYPRSLDFDAVSALVELGAGPSSLATTIRLMAGNETVTEAVREITFEIGDTEDGRTALAYRVAGSRDALVILELYTEGVADSFMAKLFNRDLKVWFSRGALLKTPSESTHFLHRRPLTNFVNLEQRLL